jgi:hypothetical protein
VTDVAGGTGDLCATAHSIRALVVLRARVPIVAGRTVGCVRWTCALAGGRHAGARNLAGAVRRRTRDRIGSSARATLAAVRLIAFVRRR